MCIKSQKNIHFQTLANSTHVNVIALDKDVVCRHSNYWHWHNTLNVYKLFLFCFLDLTKLKLLDLSLNNLRAISPGAFAGLHLTYLFLGDNPNIALPPMGFTQMSTDVIDLKNCQLTEISSSFLIPIVSRGLKKLYISGNKISRFSTDLENIFTSLDTLRIQENPLICDCKSRWLKIFYDGNKSKFQQEDSSSQMEPRCNSPVKVAGEFFNRLTAVDFLCDKPSLNTEIVFEEDKGVLRCISRAHPPPRVTWQHPTGVLEITDATEDPVTEAVIQALPTDSQIQGTYTCVASNEGGNTSTTVSLSWPLALQNTKQPCANLASSTPKEIIIPNNEGADADVQTDVFKKKYFTIIDIIIAVFGTFAGTLVVTVLVLHLCVYRKRKSSSQYSTPPQSEYSGNSIKTDGVYPSSTQHSHLHTMHNLQSRPLPSQPNQPYHKAYDENHYMSTQLDDGDDLVRLGHHNSAALVPQLSPPCQACQTLNSQPRHSQPT